MAPRHTARALIVRDDKLLLMERWRDGLHYFSIPGGGIEGDETPEQAVVREIREETSLTVTVDRPVLEMRDAADHHYIYLCEYVSGEAHLPADSPEALGATVNNRFQPGWQPLRKLPELPFLYWQPLQAPIIAGLSSGFAAQVMIVSAPPQQVN